MIFKNMMKLGLSDVRCVVKVGDTVSDIKEGKPPASGPSALSTAAPSWD